MYRSSCKCYARLKARWLIMTIFRRTYSGSQGNGGTFSFGFHISSTDALATVHSQTENWLAQFWGSSSARASSIFPTGTVIRQAKTYQYTDATTHSYKPTVHHPDTWRVSLTKETDLGDAGTNSSNSMPSDSAIVVSLRSANPSKVGRGRMYLPAPGTDQCDVNGELLVGVRDSLIGWLNAAFTAVDTGEAPVIWRNYSVLGPVSGGGEFFTVVSTLVGTCLQRQAARCRQSSSLRAPGTV
jgi:hypothetical protein